MEKSGHCKIHPDWQVIFDVTEKAEYIPQTVLKCHHDGTCTESTCRLSELGDCTNNIPLQRICYVLD